MKIMDIDEAVYDICRDWYDHESTPLMFVVAYRSRCAPDAVVDLGALLMEIEGCRKECSLPGEAEGLTQTCEILRRHIEFKDLMDMVAAVVAKAKEAGLDRHEFDAACHKAWMV